MGSAVSLSDSTTAEQAVVPAAAGVAASPMDEPAFHALYRQTSRPLWAYISRALGDPSQADDILQETYLRLLRARTPARSPQEYRALLYRIASNLVVDHFRRAKRERAAAECTPVDEATSGRDMALRVDMERIFGQLRPEERTMMWLAYVEGSDHREIAEAVGVKEKSVRVLLFRARKRLAALLKAGGVRQGER